MILKILLVLIILYVIIRTIIPFLIFPGYLFTPKVKRTIVLQNLAKKLKGKTKEKTLKNVFNYVIKNNYGLAKSTKRVYYLKNAFYNNPGKLIDKKIPLYCHNSNLLLKTLLVNTIQFKEEDIKIKWEINEILGIHQYLLIKLDNNYFKLDPFYKIQNKIKNNPTSL